MQTNFTTSILFYLDRHITNISKSAKTFFHIILGDSMEQATDVQPLWHFFKPNNTSSLQ